MLRSAIAFCCSLLLLFTTTDGFPGFFRRSSRTSLSSEFDVLIFTQRWPQTVCYIWKESSQTHTCSLPRNDEWTIHGIWPSTLHKLGPQYCNRSMAFDANILKPFEKELKTKWIDIENGTAPYSFWKHEWDKHGTCATNVEQLNTEEKYFRKALELLDKYDMKKVLGKVNILPGGRYTIGTIFKGIQDILGKRVQIMCSKDRKTRESFIFEIRTCFDKGIQLIDCDGVYDYPTNCDPSEMITYLGDVPPYYTVLRV